MKLISISFCWICFFFEETIGLPTKVAEQPKAKVKKAAGKAKKKVKETVDL